MQISTAPCHPLAGGVSPREAFPIRIPELKSKWIIANLFLWRSLVPFLFLLGNQFVGSQPIPRLPPSSASHPIFKENHEFDLSSLFLLLLKTKNIILNLALKWHLSLWFSFHLVSVNSGKASAAMSVAIYFAHNKFPFSPSCGK